MGKGQDGTQFDLQGSVHGLMAVRLTARLHPIIQVRSPTFNSLLSQISPNSSTTGDQLAVSYMEANHH